MRPTRQLEPKPAPPRPEDEVVLQAQALGDPTRHRIFRYITDADHPVGVAELTAEVRLNHNAVRQHLAVLCHARLITVQIETRHRPGRPRLLYELDSEVRGGWGTSGPMQFLASALAEVIAAGSSPYEVGLRLAGQPSNRPLDGAHQASAPAAIEAELHRRGFRPSVTQHGRSVEVHMTRCPFAEVAEQAPDVVCELHRGLTQGLSQKLGGIEITQFVRRNPPSRPCLVKAVIS
jgi:predicted ArsR family transcriptional regulator